MSPFLLDANVLIAVSVAEHEHHDRASAWLASAGDFAVSPIVEGALTRFLLRIGESSATAHAILRAIRAHPRCHFWPDSLSFTDVALPRISGHRQVTDTYLAALADANGARLATLDQRLATLLPRHTHLVA